jgi:hypothetical protein
MAKRINLVRFSHFHKNAPNTSNNRARTVRWYRDPDAAAPARRAGD